ncbi:CpaF family protein [Roseiconus lacunae]|uniref:CpaF family protein n=1 Tax=Roseiconus lacunae TaxID=2605694 RepID=UPI001E46B89C|nr:CpaF family protein [Roseiconus lacunae]MCD0462700.1 CpaF family protein [Roseiconus lacunae]WRQ51210.1 CpaF family protein [Stieleria sp. HD01]
MITAVPESTSFAMPYDDSKREIEFQVKKQQLHQRIVESLDVSTAEQMSRERLLSELRKFMRLFSDEVEMDDGEFQRVLDEMPWEMFGVGPLEFLLRSPDISDILVNHAHEVFVERNGVLESSPVVFADDQHLMRLIRRIVTRVGRRIDESCPLVDARLEDGSRINAIIPPLALDGPKLSIRRFGNRHGRLERLVEAGAMNTTMASFLDAAVRSRQSILISGGTGSGKTTMLNALSSCIPDDQRIITIEDSAELRLQHRHVARLETRPAGSENVSEYSQRDLVRNSLRMRPDRIIVGEVRGAEALDMLQAMNTGHEGSLTTIHANDTVDAISRLELMIAMAGLDLPLAVLRSYICSGISLIVHVARLPGGIRRVTRVSELNATDDGYDLIDVFRRRRGNCDGNGESGDEFVACERPRCIDRFIEDGILFDDSIFETPGDREVVR